MWVNCIIRHEKLSKIERENRERENENSTPESIPDDDKIQSTDSTPLSEKTIVNDEDDNSQIVETQQVFSSYLNLEKKF